MSKRRVVGLVPASLSLALALGGLTPQPATAQAGSVDRLDIRGTLSLPDNTALQEPLESGIVTATRIAGSGAVSSLGVLTGALPATDGSLGFEFTLPVGEVDDGSQYSLGASVRFDALGGGGPHDIYNFDSIQPPVLTGPLSPPLLPACSPPIGNPPVVCLENQDFNECAGYLRIKFVLVAGGPEILPGDGNYPQGGTVSLSQTSPAIGPDDVDPQASTTIRAGQPTLFPVQAGLCPGGVCPSGMSQTYEMNLTVTQGSDPFCDTFLTALNPDDDALANGIVIACNQTTTVEVLVADIVGDCCCCDPPGAGCPGASFADKWQLTGPSTLLPHDLEDNVVYLPSVGSTDESRVVPRVVLDRGPDGNRRLGRVFPPVSSTSSLRYSPNLPDKQMAGFVLHNVPPTSGGVSSDFNYRASSIFVINDGASSFNLSGSAWEPVIPAPGTGSSRGLPCGPGLQPCGRVGFSVTNRAQGASATDTVWTTGEMLWADCATAPPPLVPPIVLPDTNENDWLLGAGTSVPLTRCPPTAGVFLPDPGAVAECLGQVTPFQPGGAVYDSVDELKLFAYAPGQLRGALKLTDGDGICPTHLSGVLEHLDLRTGVFDTATGGAFDGILMQSSILALGEQRSVLGCTSETAIDLGETQGTFRSNLLRNTSIVETAALGERDFHFRITPAQMGNIGGWYKWSRLSLRFDSTLSTGGVLGRDGHVLGILQANAQNDPVTGLGDLRSREFVQDMNVREDLSYCFGELVVVVSSDNADISTLTAPNERSQLEVVTTSGTILAAGTPYVSPSVFDGTTFSATGGLPNRLVQFNVPLPAGQYDVAPRIWFDGATQRTKFPPFTSPCEVSCGRITKLCLDMEEPEITSITVVSNEPLDGDCENARATVDVCVNDCNGTNPVVCEDGLGTMALVDVLACTDDSDVAGTMVADPRCPVDCPYLVAEQLDYAVTDDPGSCTPVPFVDLPLADGCGAAVKYCFVVRDRVVDCNQPEVLETVSELVLTSIDDSPPTFDVPPAIHACVGGAATSLALAQPCITNLDDNCATPTVTWSSTAIGNCGGSVPPFGVDDPCADGDYALGETQVTFAIQSACDPQIVTDPVSVFVYSPPVACINTVCTDDPGYDPAVPDPHETVCRDGSTLQIPLDGSGSKGDHVDDCLSNDTVLAYSWSALTGPCTLIADPADPTNPAKQVFELAHVGDCAPAQTCTVDLTVTETLGDGTTTCDDTITYRVDILPRPQVVFSAPEYFSCHEPPSIPPDPLVDFTDVLIDACASLRCDPNEPVPSTPADADLWTWLALSGPDCPLADVELRLPDDPNAPPCQRVLRYRGEACAECLVGLVVSDPDSDCASAAATVPVKIVTSATPDPGGPYQPTCQPANMPLTIQLDSSGTILPDLGPSAPCCTDVEYTWLVSNCPGASFSPDEHDPDAILSIPSTTDANECQLCLTVRTCADEDPAMVPADQKGCLATCCTTISTCRGPDADFTAELLPVFASNQCNSTAPTVQYRNTTDWGDCDPAQRQSVWDFDDGLGPRAPLLGAAASADPTPVPYTLAGRIDPTLTASIGGDCPDTAMLPCGLCLPACTRVQNDPDGGIDLKVDCQGPRPPGCPDITFPPTLTAELTFEDVDVCCDSPSIAAGATVSLTFSGCAGGADSHQVDGVVVGSMIMGGGNLVVEVGFAAVDVIDAVTALGCTCASIASGGLSVRAQFSGAMDCATPPAAPCSLATGPYFPLNLDLTLLSPAGFRISCAPGAVDCLAAYALQGCASQEFDCNDGFDNDSDGLVDCLDPDCLGIDLDGDGSPGGDCGADCDDADPNNSPLLGESCADGQDNDCDGLVDCADGDCSTDADGDGFQASPCGSDCDDADALVFPGQVEDCLNLTDDDCDGLVDDADPECFSSIHCP